MIDTMIKIPDTAAIAAIHWLEQQIGRKTGASTGTNLFGALLLAAKMKQAGDTGSIVTLICDPGERYLDTYYNPDWITEHIGCCQAMTDKLTAFNHSGELTL